MGTLLGFDYGPRKIGVAVGQTVTRTASPLATLRAVRAQPDWKGISRLIDLWHPEALVVGLPFNMDDSEAEPAPLARRFANGLKGRYGLRVFLVDERLTSLEALARLGGKSRNASDIDAVAAKLILETWLSEQP